MDQTFLYNGILYRWEQSKAQKTYNLRRITIHHAVQALTDPNAVIINQNHRWKYIGLSDIGVLIVITTSDVTRIITAWRASRTEVKEYLQGITESMKM